MVRAVLKFGCVFLNIFVKLLSDVTLPPYWWRNGVWSGFSQLLYDVGDHCCLELDHTVLCAAYNVDVNYRHLYGKSAERHVG